MTRASASFAVRPVTVTPYATAVASHSRASFWWISTSTFTRRKLTAERDRGGHLGRRAREERAGVCPGGASGRSTRSFAIPLSRCIARCGGSAPRCASNWGLCRPRHPGYYRRSPMAATFRRDIEGLRGIAVLIVVAFHTGVPGFSGGFIGVDVFFVLSGYLITGLLVAEVDSTSRLSLLQFYARRVKRLLPAAALALLVTLCIGAVILSPNELIFAGRAGKATALYLTNVFFAVNAADYFAPDVETNPLLHTWTLALVEQFYLAWPLLIMLALQWWRSRRALWVILAGLTVTSLLSSIWFTAAGGTFAFYGLPTRAWEFGIGGMAALVPRGALRLPTRAIHAIGWLGLTAIGVSAHFISGEIGFPGWIAAVPVLGTAAALIAGAEAARGPAVLLGAAPLQFVGSLSYSWYLWHWPFLVFSAALIPDISVLGRMAAAGASLAVAWGSHRVLENPIRFSPYLSSRPGLSLALGAVLSLSSLGVAIASVQFGVRLAEAPEMRVIAAAANDVATIERQRCVASRDSSDVKACTFGNSAPGAPRLVLFGDSHALQWFNPVHSMVRAHGWALTTMIKSACPTADVDVGPRAYLQNFSTGCHAWRSAALRQIVALRPAAVVIGHASVYLGRPNKRPSRFDVTAAEWRKGTRRTLEVFAAAEILVIMIRDNPLPHGNVPTCLARALRSGGSCDMERRASLNPAVFEAERAAGRGLSGVYFMDFT